MTAERQRSCDGMWRSYETWRIRVPVCSHALRGPWGLAERPARAVRTPVGVLHDSCATPCAPWALGRKQFERPGAIYIYMERGVSLNTATFYQIRVYK